MLTDKGFVTSSTDINLFFLRIMKEHALFIQLGFMPRAKALSEKAGYFNSEFNKLLKEAIVLSEGNVSQSVIDSGQLITQHTLEAERLTQYYTGVNIDTALTSKESRLTPAGDTGPEALIINAVEMLDRRAYQLTAALADYKEQLFNDAAACKMFMSNFPSLIEHMLYEAKLYMNMLVMLVNRKDIMDETNFINMQVFWNQIMGDHSAFIAGMLDPFEVELKKNAEKFVQEYNELTAKAMQVANQQHDTEQITTESANTTGALRDFKAAATKGLLDCNIQSVILPLMADHLLREANHYLCNLSICRA